MLQQIKILRILNLQVPKIWDRVKQPVLHLNPHFTHPVVPPPFPLAAASLSLVWWSDRGTSSQSVFGIVLMGSRAQCVSFENGHVRRKGKKWKVTPMLFTRSRIMCGHKYRSELHVLSSHLIQAQYVFNHLQLSRQLLLHWSLLLQFCTNVRPNRPSNTELRRAILRGRTSAVFE